MRKIYVLLFKVIIILILAAVSCTTAVPEVENKGGEEPGLREGGEESQPAALPSQEPPAPDTQPQERLTADPSPQQQPLPEPQPIPEEPVVADHKYQELALYALELINRDRIENRLSPVVMGGNTASQIHAEESLAHSYASHWSMDGLKPYMRYTLAGGVNYVGENVIFTGASGGPSEKRAPKELLEQAQEMFMNSPTHRANILYKTHKKVSLGIAYDDSNLALVQNFEGDDIGFSKVPTISGMVFSMAGKLKTGNFKQIAIHYDPLPEPLSPEQLNASPYDSSYSLGRLIGYILPPPPPGSQYPNLPSNYLIATTWDTRSEGWFIIGAALHPILREGIGVYTIVVWADIGGEPTPVSNYSIFVQ